MKRDIQIEGQGKHWHLYAAAALTGILLDPKIRFKEFGDDSCQQAADLAGRLADAMELREAANENSRALPAPTFNDLDMRNLPDEQRFNHSQLKQQTSTKDSVS